MSALAWQAAWRRCVTAARRVIGVPDYDAYIAHLRIRHPEKSLPTRAEFFAERQQVRYAGGAGRCC